jgi:YrbI family 3-deoxy-D-manno-octulosonate 8-phosphate phosphatase
VIVSSDSADILLEGRRAGARAVERPGGISGSTASSESALLHALDVLEREDGAVPEVVLLVQCTSPFMRADDLDGAVDKVLSGGADVSFAVANNHAFLWKFGPAGADGGVVGVNHDETLPRARRQDLPPEFRETGAFYVMRTQGLRQAGRRFFGRIVPQLVPDEYALEIDSFDDLIRARMLASVISQRDPSGPLIDVDAVVTDFDGVHTDDTLHLTQDGVESVRVSREDGMGVALARKAGIQLLILSTEVNPVVTARANKLKIPAVQGQSDKGQALKQWIAEHGLDPDRVAYLGNDVNDLGCLAQVGWPIAVANAHPEVKAAARYELSRSGGSGAVRELCELVVAAVSARTASAERVVQAP